jgi:hypothetical protein
MSNICSGNGECFKQSSSDSYFRTEECPEKCKLKECSDCGTGHPKWYLDCHGGSCVSCAIIGRSSNNICIECGKVLVPVGTSRSNGKSHDDWPSRKMHKKCWIKKQSES